MMKHLYDTEAVAEVEERISRLRPNSERVWGKMSPAQALAHCSVGLEMALGEKNPPRMFLGRILGGLVKSKALGEEPLQRNSPTAKVLIVDDPRNFDAERTVLVGLVDRFAANGPQRCTTHPHTFFGPLAPDQWARLMYKHLDHHLRQFGV